MKSTSRILLVLCLFVSGRSFGEESTNESFFSKNQKFDASGSEQYVSNVDLKKHKKIGAGLSLGGVSGFFGINGELNLDPQEALIIGLGTGPSYGSFNLQWKHSFEAKFLSTYFKAGYSKWFGSSANANSAKSSDVLKAIYSDKELTSGKFDSDFLVSSYGIEGNQLSGEYSGVNFFGELTMMIEVKKTKFIPTGAVGMTYFY